MAQSQIVERIITKTRLTDSPFVAQNWQLKWYRDRQLDMDVVNGPKSATVDLVGMAQYAEAVDDQVIIVRIADQRSNGSDVYISYNRVRKKKRMISHSKLKRILSL